MTKWDFKLKVFEFPDCKAPLSFGEGLGVRSNKNMNFFINQKSMNLQT
jgi:hypothetical protein